MVDENNKLMSYKILTKLAPSKGFLSVFIILWVSVVLSRCLLMELDIL